MRDDIITLEGAIALVGHGFHPDTTEYVGLTGEQNDAIQRMLDTYDPRRDVYLDALEILENN